MGCSVLPRFGRKRICELDDEPSNQRFLGRFQGIGRYEERSGSKAGMDAYGATRERSRYNGTLRRKPFLCLLVLGMPAGCATQRIVVRPDVANHTLGPMTIAVAPALNLSGASDFDPNRFADLMASELTLVEGVKVVPVSRVLGVLTMQGHSTVESPEHARELIQLLGCDAILVFAITEYDPYDPPRIGVSAQLYGTRPCAGGGAVDPVALSRQASLAGAPATPGNRWLLAQSQRVIDSSHAAVVDEIRRYARLRDGGNSPYGWRKFMVSQQDYIRFCCFVTILELVGGRDDPQLAGG